MTAPATLAREITGTVRLRWRENTLWAGDFQLGEVVTFDARTWKATVLLARWEEEETYHPTETDAVAALEAAVERALFGDECA